MKNKFCITFAGPPGSSKTPIATYLSCQLNLPIFNKDAIRTEVKEDLLVSSEEETHSRAHTRISALLNSSRSFILDISVDRNWSETKENLKKFGYRHFVISLDFTKELLVKIWKAKKYDQFQYLDDWIVDHNKFVANHKDTIDIHLTDKDFPHRLELCLEATKEWLAKTD